MRAVTIFQLIGLGTCGAGQKLVAEADAHQGAGSLPIVGAPVPALGGSGYFCSLVFQECAYVLYRRLTTLRVAWTVGEEETVEVELVEVVVPRHADDLDASSDEAADDVRLYSAVDKDNFFH